MPSLIAAFDMKELPKEQSEVRCIPQQRPNNFHAYRNCKWCGGAGCICCQGEADKAYKAAFPDGPKPIAIIDLTTPDGVAKGRKLLSSEAIAGFIEEGTQEAKARIEGDSVLRSICASMDIPIDDALARELGRQALPAKIAAKAIELGLSPE